MSSTQFIEVVIPCEESQKELILASLDMAGYDSILETETGLNAYIEKNHFDQQPLRELAETYSLDFQQIQWNLQEQRNWNEEWETNFEPVVIDDLCLVRAPFHQPGNGKFQYELIILPKMSFGTGHHATTYLMIKNQILHLDHKNKKVLDAGCGTAILAVMAEKLGGASITAYDIDDWSRENAPENVDFNKCKNITVLQGTINSLSLSQDYDIILANINKNVLLEEISAYYNHLKPGGKLLLSGFFNEDIKDLNDAAEAAGFHKLKKDSKDRWACLLYKK